jgi:LysM repeat protein
MRVRLLLAGAVAAVVTAAPSAALASSQNAQVAGLQVALRAQGLYRGAIDAISGPKTVAAVRAFQRVHGLPVTGIADSRTRKRLGPLGRPLFGARTLRHGEFGWDVAVLQFLLIRQGIDVPVNAYFDAPTLRGVRRLQRRLHVRGDGIVGPRTLTKLVRREPVPLPVRHSRPVSRPAHRPARRPAHTRVHVVRSGESLWALAKRYGTTLTKLARLNHLDPARPLLVGTRLRIPGALRHVATAPVAYRSVSVAAVRSLLDHWAAHYGVSTKLVRALAWMESGYNNKLVSKAGARGIMQLLPTTWSYVETVLLGRKVRHTASGNVRVGVAYLAHLLHVFHGNKRLALAGWYQGERAVRQRGVLEVSRVFVANVLALERRM